MHFSPNIGERSSKCASATLKVSFSLQFWVSKREFESPPKKNVNISFGFHRYFVKLFISHISCLTTPLTKNDVVRKIDPNNNKNAK